MLEVQVAPRARVSILGAYGLIGFAVAAAVHVGTYVDLVLPVHHRLGNLLHFGIVPLFVVFVKRMQGWHERQSSRFRRRYGKLRWGELRPYFPAWVPPTFVVGFVYVLVNFAASIRHLPPGGENASLTPAQAMYTTRAFSGHWLLFYGVPALYFLFVPATARPRPDVSEET